MERLLCFFHTDNLIAEILMNETETEKIVREKVRNFAEPMNYTFTVSVERFGDYVRRVSTPESLFGDYLQEEPVSIKLSLPDMHNKLIRDDIVVRLNARFQLPRVFAGKIFKSLHETGKHTVVLSQM
jgi:hypothetical protein